MQNTLLDFSKNSGKRKETHFIIVHYTEIDPLDNVLAYFAQDSVRASCHFIIDTCGTITKWIPADQIAWHAGQSLWEDEKNLNATSIGIELVYTPTQAHKAFLPFDPQQINSLTRLISALMQTYAIKPENILGHSDIAVGRKADPGPCFPWHHLKRQGMGLSTLLADKTENEITLWEAFFAHNRVSEHIIAKWLKSLGYRFMPALLSEALWAFGCHFASPWPSQIPAPLTLARLYLMAREKTKKGAKNAV